MGLGRIMTDARLDELQKTVKRVQVVFDGRLPPEDFVVPGAMRSHTEGPVVTAVVRVLSETQLHEVRAIPGARVNVFPLGLEDMFIELLGHRAVAQPGRVET